MTGAQARRLRFRAKPAAARDPERRAEGHTRGNVYPKLLATLADLERRRSNFKASFDLLKRKQALDDLSGATGTVDYLAGRREEAVMILMAWGEYRGARSILEGIDTRWRAITGDDATPPWLDFSRGRLALHYDQLDHAHRILADAAARARRRNALESALEIELWLAQVQVRRGQFTETEHQLSRQAESEAAAGRWPMLTPATILAALQRGRGAVTEAASTIEGNLPRLASSPVSSVALAAALREAAYIQLSAGDAGNALRFAGEAAEVSQRVARNPDASADVGEALLLVARAQRVLGRRAESVATARESAKALAAGLSEDHRLTREALALAGS